MHSCSGLRISFSSWAVPGFEEGLTVAIQDFPVDKKFKHYFGLNGVPSRGSGIWGLSWFEPIGSHTGLLKKRRVLKAQSVGHVGLGFKLLRLMVKVRACRRSGLKVQVLKFKALGPAYLNERRNLI